MDLSSPNLYWPQTCARGTPARPLNQDIACDVLVIGAGISGAMAACLLGRAGLNVVLTDRRSIAAGSTAASTALVMYEIDHSLLDLVARLGSDHAASAYLASRRALDSVIALVDTLDDPCELTARRGLYLASKPDNLLTLHAEARARNAIGIPVETLDAHTLEAIFNIRRPGALLTDLALELNPVKLTRALCRAAEAVGVRIFDRTELELPPCDGRPHVCKTRIVEDDTGRALNKSHAITARHIVIATGYETPEQFAIVNALTTLKSTYVVVSKPLDSAPWAGRTLIWETARPYAYLRTIHGDVGGGFRVIIGGEDNSITAPRLRDAQIAVNTHRLVRKAAQIIGGLRIEPEFAYAGTFAETDDGLPFIGTLDRWPGVHFALGYGGNGFTFSLIAAEIIRDAILDRKNPAAETFSFSRALERAAT